MTARRTRKIIAQKSVTTENNSNPQFTSNNQLMKDSNIQYHQSHLQYQKQVKSNG